jgi:hypothetical protein
MGRRAFTAAALALVLIAPGSAHASTEIATNPAGDQVLFHQVLGFATRPLYVTTRHPGTGFGPVRPAVPPPGIFYPAARVDDSGAFVATWAVDDSLHYSRLHPTPPPTHEVAIGTPDGGVGTPTSLPGDFFSGQDFASNPRGDTIVASTDRGPSHYLYRPAGGDFGPPGDLPGSGGAAFGFAVDPDGTALVVLFGPNGELLQSTRPPGGEFGPPTEITAVPADAYPVEFAASRGGRALIVFGMGRTVAAVERPPGGSFGPLFRVASHLKHTQPLLAAAVTDSGAAVVSYTPQDHTYMVARDPGGPFSAPRKVDPYSRFAVNDRGDAAAVWNGTARLVRGVYRRAGSRSFGATRTLASRDPLSTGAFYAPSIEQPSIALDDSGRATATWEVSDGTTVRAIVRDFDASGLRAPVAVDALPTLTQEAPSESCRPAGVPIRRSTRDSTVFGSNTFNLYGCLLARGTPVELAPRLFDVVDQPPRTMSLAGPFVALGRDFSGRGFAYSRFTVIDLRDEHYGLNREADLDGPGMATLLDSRLKANAAAAWISRRRGGKLKRVWAWDQRRSRPRLLDRGLRVAPRSLELKGSRLTWRRRGKLHHATLR